MKYKLVLIKWIDSVVSANRWTWDDEIDFKTYQKAMYHTSVGYLIHEDKIKVCLSQSVKDEPAPSGAISISDPITIPVVAIIKRKVLKTWTT